jgi:uncharacterized protein (TIGR02569 family)
VLAPTVGVARAFRVNDRALLPLPGGQDTAWTDGRLVLKPVAFPAEHAWVCDVYADWPASDVVRVPEPVASFHGHGWLVEGWGAHVLVPGRDLDLPTELPVVRAASDAFHAVVADLPRPAFLDDRTDPWSFGDRVAFEGFEPQGDAQTLRVIARLRQALRPVYAHDQVIHGDILPNVLVAPALPPAVIDWPPYYRPAGLANAIAATDAVTFHGAPLALFDEWAAGRDWDQLLVRALLYRLATTGWFAARDRLRGSLRSHLARACEVVDAVLARSA